MSYEIIFLTDNGREVLHGDDFFSAQLNEYLIEQSIIAPVSSAFTYEDRTVCHWWTEGQLKATHRKAITAMAKQYNADIVLVDNSEASILDAIEELHDPENRARAVAIALRFVGDMQNGSAEHFPLAIACIKQWND